MASFVLMRQRWQSTATRAAILTFILRWGWWCSCYSVWGCCVLMNLRHGTVIATSHINWRLIIRCCCYCRCRWNNYRRLITWPIPEKEIVVTKWRLSSRSCGIYPSRSGLLLLTAVTSPMMPCSKKDCVALTSVWGGDSSALRVRNKGT